jgi:hypothetical protein
MAAAIMFENLSSSGATSTAGTAVCDCRFDQRIDVALVSIAIDASPHGLREAHECDPSDSHQ